MFSLEIRIQVPRTIQFDESSDEYRCLCNCFHVKTGSFIVGGIHILIILFFLIHCLLIYLQHDGRLQEVRSQCLHSPSTPCNYGWQVQHPSIRTPVKLYENLFLGEGSEGELCVCLISNSDDWLISGYFGSSSYVLRTHSKCSSHAHPAFGCTSQSSWKSKQKQFFQCLSIVILLVVIVCGIIAICTDTAVFYRIINAAPFMEHPRQNTVALDTGWC